MGRYTSKKAMGRQRRKARVHKKVLGDSGRPRLCVYRSLKHISAQIIDDVSGTTLCSLTTASKDFADKAADVKGKKARSGLLGKMLAQKAIEKGINTIRFDRGGNAYHGRIRALAESAREEGLVF